MGRLGPLSQDLHALDLLRCFLLHLLYSHPHRHLCRLVPIGWRLLVGPIGIFCTSSILTLTVICVGKFLLAGVFWEYQSGSSAPPLFSLSPSSVWVSSYWLAYFWKDQSGSSPPPPFSLSPSSVLVRSYWLAYSGSTNQDLLHLLYSHSHRHLCG